MTAKKLYSHFVWLFVGFFKVLWFIVMFLNINKLVYDFFKRIIDRLVDGVMFIFWGCLILFFVWVFLNHLSVNQTLNKENIKKSYEKIK